MSLESRITLLCDRFGWLLATMRQSGAKGPPLSLRFLSFPLSVPPCTLPALA